MPKITETSAPARSYTTEQNAFIIKQSVFYNLAKNGTTPLTLKEFLEIFFSEWFLNWPEPSLLTGFEREAAEHWRRKDLIRMLQWSCWSAPALAKKAEDPRIVHRENNEARLNRLERRARVDAATAAHLTAASSAQHLTAKAAMPKLLPRGSVRRLGPGPSTADINTMVLHEVNENGKIDFLSGWDTQQID